MESYLKNVQIARSYILEEIEPSPMKTDESIYASQSN